MTDDQIRSELAKEVNLTGDEEVGLLKKNLQASYVQTWNKAFIDNELKLNYEIADLQKGVKFIPDKIPEGFFSFSVYNKWGSSGWFVLSVIHKIIPKKKVRGYEW